MSLNKLYVIAFYEEAQFRDSYLRIDGDQTSDSYITPDNIQDIKFFKDRDKAEKECNKQNKEIEECGLQEEAVVEEVILHIK